MERNVKIIDYQNTQRFGLGKPVTSTQGRSVDMKLEWTLLYYKTGTEGNKNCISLSNDKKKIFEFIQLNIHYSGQCYQWLIQEGTE